MAWPVNASSTWALSEPVCFHCSMKRGRDRAAITRTVRSDSGTLTSATSASSGEMMTIITSTPTSVSSEVSSWLSVC